MSTYPPKPITNLAATSAAINTGGKHMSVAHLTWTWPTQRTDTPPSTIPVTEALSADIYDYAVSTTVPVATVQRAVNFTTGSWSSGQLAPGSSHQFVAVVHDGALTSAPSNDAALTMPSAPPAAINDLIASVV